jgi:hypothetical protein
METRARRIGRWVVGSAAFMGVGAIMFEAAGQSSPRPLPARANVYRRLEPDNRDVRTALNFALADQRKKNRSSGTVTFIKVLTAEHQVHNGDNFRLCLALDRRGRSDTARAVVHRSSKLRWSVSLWAWGACSG